MKYYYLAQAYGSGNYGQNTYTGETTTGGGNGSVGAGGNTSAGAANGSLANTGIYVLAIVSLACFLIFLALAVRLMRRKKAVKNNNLPAVIPGQHPIDTLQQPTATTPSQNQNPAQPQSAAPEVEKSETPKRIDF